MQSPEIIVIGAGPSGIALAHTLKHKLGFADFTVSELGIFELFQLTQE
jgi:cation diffusion facilitator CzcD-associated flavoprotein CzcO